MPKVPWNKGVKGYKIHDEAFKKRISDRWSGAGNPGWKGGRGWAEEGRYVMQGGHKNRHYEHRRVVENFLGRKLHSKEVVHHWDEDKHNNSIENLGLFRNNTAHLHLHRCAKQMKIPVKALWFDSLSLCSITIPRV